MGVAVLHVGLVMQLAGFLFAFALGDPIAGDRLLTLGFWVAGLGGSGLVYGLLVNVGGSAPYRGGPLSYAPPGRRWPAALWAFALVGLWGVLSLPLAFLFYGTIAAGSSVYGCTRLMGRRDGES